MYFQPKKNEIDWWLEAMIRVNWAPDILKLISIIGQPVTMKKRASFHDCRNQAKNMCAMKLQFQKQRNLNMAWPLTCINSQKKKQQYPKMRCPMMWFLVMSYPFLPRILFVVFFCAPWDEGTTGVVLKESHFLPHQGLAKLRIWHCCHGRCVVVRRPKWLAVFLHFWMLLNSMWMDCHIILLLDGATFYSSLAWNILYIYTYSIHDSIDHQIVKS